MHKRNTTESILGLSPTVIRFYYVEQKRRINIIYWLYAKNIYLFTNPIKRKGFEIISGKHED